MEHPTQDALQRFLLGRTTRTENRSIVRHLLARCPACATTLQKIWKEPPISPAAYEQALDRFEEQLRNLTGAKPKPAPLTILSTL
jgi:anti-sigma factor RsiW